MSCNLTTELVNRPEKKTQTHARPRSAPKRAHDSWRRMALLTAEEERALAARIKTGDTAARERLILANLRLVVKLAQRYPRSGASLDDMIQEGTRGLIRAADCFDPQTHNTRFSTYATHWIRKGIQVAVEASGPLIRVPAYLLRLRYRFERVMDELRSADSAASPHNQTGSGSNGESLPRAAEKVMASRLNVSDDQLGLLRQSIIRRSSLYQKNAKGEEIAIEAMASSRYHPDSELELAEARHQLHRAIDSLSAVESLLIRYRFGISDTRCKQRRQTAQSTEAATEACDSSTPPGRIRTYTTVGQALGISVHQVRRIERGALAKLRAVLDPGLLTGLG
jgi:RNA polymerase sigma factor (sigma-70 family)